MCERDLRFQRREQTWLSGRVMVAAVGAVMVAQPSMSEASAESIYRGVASSEKVPKQLVASYLERWFGDVEHLGVSLRRHENGELEGLLYFDVEASSVLDESVVLDTSDRRQWGRTLARVFLEKHAEPLFEITRLNELHEFTTLVGEKKRPYETVIVIFHRYIQGMQVRKFNLHMTFREGAKDSIHIKLAPVPEVLQRVAQTPLLTEQQVRDIVFALPNWEETLKEHRTQKMKMEKVITPRCLAYKVTTSAWEVWMDAATGEVFEVLPLIIWN